MYSQNGSELRIFQQEKHREEKRLVYFRSSAVPLVGGCTVGGVNKNQPAYIEVCTPYIRLLITCMYSVLTGSNQLSSHVRLSPVPLSKPSSTLVLVTRRRP